MSLHTIKNIIITFICLFSLSTTSVFATDMTAVYKKLDTKLISVVTTLHKKVGVEKANLLIKKKLLPKLLKLQRSWVSSTKKALFRHVYKRLRSVVYDKSDSILKVQLNEKTKVTKKRRRKKVLNENSVAKIDGNSNDTTTSQAEVNTGASSFDSEVSSTEVVPEVAFVGSSKISNEEISQETLKEQSVKYDNQELYSGKPVLDDDVAFLFPLVWDYVDYDDYGYTVKDDIIYTYIFEWTVDYYDLDNPDNLLYFQQRKPDKSHLLYKRDGKYAISKISDFKKYEMFHKDLLEWVKQKNKLILFLIERVKTYHDFYQDYEVILKQIKEKSLELVKDKHTRAEKIQVLYAFVIDHLEYDESLPKTWKVSFDLVFSWVWAFKTQIWVCDAYARLLLTMLYFAGIEDVDYKVWMLYDNVEFWDIWHAWLKVWDFYYDPTHEDPFWNTMKKIYSNYEYYRLPNEIMYANRTDGLESDKVDVLKKLDNEWRKKLVEVNYLTLAKIHSDYNVLNRYYLKNKVWLRAWESLTIESLKKLVRQYIQIDKFHTFVDNNGEIKKLVIDKFYPIDLNENLDDFLYQNKLDERLLLKTHDWQYMLTTEAWYSTRAIITLNDFRNYLKWVYYVTEDEQNRIYFIEWWKKIYVNITKFYVLDDVSLDIYYWREKELKDLILLIPQNWLNTWKYLLSTKEAGYEFIDSQ